MGLPAARLTDVHTCPMVTGVVPHVGGPIIGPGCPTVLIGGLPAARTIDMAVCCGPPDMISTGSLSVFIGGLPAARIGDLTAHGGVITLGCPTVLIGDKAGGAPTGGDGGASVVDAAPGGGAADVAGAGTTMDQLLSSGAAMTAPMTQARALVRAAQLGLPFCERCATGR